MLLRSALMCSKGCWKGLVLAEAEFESSAEPDALTIPKFIAHKVSNNARFTGELLVHASRRDLETWLSDYGVKLSDRHELRGWESGPDNGRFAAQTSRSCSRTGGTMGKSIERYDNDYSPSGERI